MQLQHLGETAFKIHKNYKHTIADHHKIVGLRNIISHDYLGITNERLRTILTKSIPALHESIKKEIKSYNN